MKWKQRLLAAGLVVVGVATVHAEAAGDASQEGTAACGRQPVVALEIPAEGSTKLCNRRDGITATMRARGLTPGEAYTVWWVYIDDPLSCENPGECGLADFAGENPMPVFGRMDSAVAGTNGRVRFSDHLRGLEPSDGSQIWLLVFGHGPADESDNRHRARQLLTPEDPNAGTPHLGNNVDGGLGFPAAVTVFGF